MALARGVHDLLGAAVGLDGLGDEAAVPGATGRLDLGLAVAAGGFRLLQDALVGPGQGMALVKRVPGRRDAAARPGRARPSSATRRGTAPRPGRWSRRSSWTRG